MKVTGNNLTNICMVVYRVAKTERNDQLFHEEDMLSKSLLISSYWVLNSQHNIWQFTFSPVIFNYVLGSFQDLTFNKCIKTISLFKC